MARNPRDDAIAIWQAGLDAVRSDRLVRNHVHVDSGRLAIGDTDLLFGSFDRIVVVGAGKAGAGMVAGLEEALTPLAEEKSLSGWVNVPANCVRPTRWIHLHPARPAEVNEPTEAGVAGAERMLELVGSLTRRDLCLCLISGGGSALLPAPARGITLEDKLRVTRFLSASGANIEQLNIVRKQLSRIKGGRLARACRAGYLWTLVISDVLGDPLDLIASGPTVPDRSTPRQALEILIEFGYEQVEGAERVLNFLKRRAADDQPADESSGPPHQDVAIIGSNATAVDAAGIAADELGYRPAMISARSPEGAAEEVARHLAEMALRMQREPGPDCLISGGEPTVALAPAEIRGKGGRNQQLAMAALSRLLEENDALGLLANLAILSAGTDGEDGPTDAAGAWIDEAVYRRAVDAGLDVRDFLRRNDGYHFFSETGGLLKTGPTDTNVCDVRVITVRRCE